MTVVDYGAIIKGQARDVPLEAGDIIYVPNSPFTNLKRYVNLIVNTFIGRNPMNENVYIASGDSGMGMTHGTIAGILLTDLIQGRKNPWTHVYDPSRKTLGAFAEYANSLKYGKTGSQQG